MIVTLFLDICHWLNFNFYIIMDEDDVSTLSQPLPPLIKSASRTSMDDSISWFHGKITREAAEHVLDISKNTISVLRLFPF